MYNRMYQLVGAAFSEALARSTPFDGEAALLSHPVIRMVPEQRPSRRLLDRTSQGLVALGSLTARNIAMMCAVPA